MSIDSIKEIMDGFDPAALLPDLTTLVGKVELVARIAVLVGPIILLILGLLYCFAAPKEANYHFGYRCFFGMGSVDAWRFTQRLAGMVWAGLGLVLTVVMFFVTGSFRSLEVMDMVGRAATGLIWEVALVALACLAVNIVVMTQFDAKGEHRGRSRK